MATKLKEITRETAMICKGRKIMMTVGPQKITFWLKGKRETFTLPLDEAFSRSTLGIERAIFASEARPKSGDPMRIHSRSAPDVDIDALEKCVKGINDAR